MLSLAQSRLKDLENNLVKLTKELMDNLPKNIRDNGYQGLFVSGGHETYILTKKGVRRRWRTIDEETFVHSFLYRKSSRTPLELVRYLENKLNKIADLYQIKLSNTHSK